MAGVIEFPIVWHEGLYDIRIRHAVRLDQPSVLGGEERIVFADAAIVVFLVPVHGNVAKHDRDALRGGDDILSAAFAVTQERGLLPGVAQEITRDGHFRENDDIDGLLFGIRGHSEDLRGVLIRMARNDLHLGHGNFQQSETLLFVTWDIISCIDDGEM